MPPKHDEVLVLGDGPHAVEVVELLSLVGYGAKVCSKDQEPLEVLNYRDLVLGLGNPAERIEAFARYRFTHRFLTLIHPSVVLSRTARIGEGSVLTAGVVVSSNVTLAEGVLLNWNATIGHDAVLGDCVTIGPQAAVSGHVTVGRGSMVGAGAIILQGLNVGAFSRVGAGAVVTKDVRSGATVKGVPATEVPLR